MDTNKQSIALAELQSAFGMSNPPNRMECYDISNTQGTASVGSMVVFEQGVPNKKHYRRFNIKTVTQRMICQHGRGTYPSLPPLAGLSRKQ
jgi:excinuclease ABC subunit C